MEKKVKSRIYVHKPMWSIPYRLVIEGYEGHGKTSYGGTYKFVATYISSVELEKRGEICLEKWCEIKQIPFIHSDTFGGLTEQLKTFDRPELKKLHQF